ncbi:MAG: response regulator [Thermoanaerobaculia bacterium]|nr:response regulator [Thermoanaerobaculia bacterium]
MSLLGRLEDLSLPDIVQIVYLSRRTGMLEIVDGENRWGIFFVNGLIANAFAPHDETIVQFLRQSKALEEAEIDELERRSEEGAVVGDLIVSKNLLSSQELAELIRVRITNIVQPLLTRRSGEFNFLLSDAIGPREIGYDTERLFKQGGILPAEILEEGEKAKPLQNLEETMRAGKALLRGDKGSDAAAFGFGEEIEQMTAKTRKGVEEEDLEDTEDDEAEADFDEEVSPFEETDETTFAELELAEEEVIGGQAESAGREEEISSDDVFGKGDEYAGTGDLTDLLSESSDEDSTPPVEDPTEDVESPPPTSESPAETEIPAEKPVAEEKVGSLAVPPQARSMSQFRVEREEQLGLEDRNVVIFERNPMIRVAAKRAFGQNNFQIYQFGRIDEVQRTVSEMLDANRFFVSFLELIPEEQQLTTVLLHQIKRTNRHLPVVVIDSEASLERRHQLLKLGCDMYLTKPSPSHLEPAIADRSLALFADELVQFADNAVQNWERLTQTFGEGEAVGATLYEIAEKERLNRTRTLMRSLINELADPDDINQVSQTILRLADEYLDRAALFAASPTRFIGLGGFGPTGTDEEMNQLARRIRIARDADSVLRDVTVSRSAHKGKLRKTDANVKLLTGLGKTKPTQVVVIPIENEGTSVGVLYGDNAGQRSAIGKTSGLEIFLEQAGLALHNAIITNARRKGLDWETK